MPFTKEDIKSQEEHVKAISYQLEAAHNASCDAQAYHTRISEHYQKQLANLKHMKKESN